MALKIFNTLSGAKENFVPLTPGQVRMYVCGVTVYDSAHVGHARSLAYLRDALASVVVSHGLAELDGRIQLGASPRASIVLALCARANAFLSHRAFVTPADVKRVAPPVLRHRVVPSYEAEAEGRTSDHLVARVLETVPVP